jgi:hypothetical protein
MTPLIAIAVQTAGPVQELTAVDFYRRLGFAVDSLGEKYPGTEWFLCRWTAPPEQPTGSAGQGSGDTLRSERTMRLHPGWLTFRCVEPTAPESAERGLRIDGIFAIVTGVGNRDAGSGACRPGRRGVLAWITAAPCGRPDANTVT